MANILGIQMLAEFIGTFILACAIEFNTRYCEGLQSGNVFCILGGFFIAITVTRELSGGHINPAVTITFYLIEKDQKVKNEKANQMWMYIISQLAGAICAAVLGIVIYNNNVFKLAPNLNANIASAFILEVIGSALFYTVILVQSNRHAALTNDKTMSTLIITAGLAAGSAFAGNISGACLNPAIGFGFNFGRILQNGKMEECKFLWGYILAPIIGSFCASYFYTEYFSKYFELDEISDRDNAKAFLISEMNEINETKKATK